MNKTAFSKNKLVANIVCSIIGYAVFASEFYFSLLHQSRITGALVPLCLALYSTVWIGSYVKLQGLRNTGMNEELLQKAEQRQMLFLSIFGSVAGMLVMCYSLFLGILTSYSVWHNIILVVFTLYFTYLVHRNIQKI